MPQTTLAFNTGPQDALLHDPSRSYFANVGYVRTNNFETEFKDITPTNTAAFGTTTYYTIDRAADLLGNLDLVLDMDVTGTAGSNHLDILVDGFGYAMIDKVTLSVGTNTIQEIEGEWLQIENSIYRDKDFRYNDLVQQDYTKPINTKHPLSLIHI